MISKAASNFWARPTESHHQQLGYLDISQSSTCLLLLMLMPTFLSPADHLAAGAHVRVADFDSNTLDRTMKPLDVNLPPTLPMNFGTDNSTLVRAQIGSTAHLPCVVHNIGEGVVTWIRRQKDHHLLTVGLTTWASDERFQARHFQHSEDWTLQVKFVQPKDAGLYECQVSVHPPSSIFLFLEVVGELNIKDIINTLVLLKLLSAI
ncbi:hypothetical protein QAD02_019674 [Eretmocerus hayati]|uniref:Uncharacterized protein n=1 Tax=Eretmocerus hayati TaxID=131215 RepID=A0ACC2PK91_9HYME|nr:hypothetical protein QAD02_019674 [Eretmocerus hayati]